MRSMWFVSHRCHHDRRSGLRLPDVFSAMVERPVCLAGMRSVRTRVLPSLHGGVLRIAHQREARLRALQGGEMIDTNYATALVEAAAEYCRVPACEVVGERKTKGLSTARHATAYVLRGEGYYLREIGEFFGRDHTTILGGVKKVDHLIKCGDHETVRLVSHIKNRKPAAIPVTSTREAEVVLRALIRVGGDIQVLAAALQEMAAKVTRQAELSIEEIRLREVA